MIVEIDYELNIQQKESIFISLSQIALTAKKNRVAGLLPGLIHFQ
jgi:hypothetical protein